MLLYFPKQAANGGEQSSKGSYQSLVLPTTIVNTPQTLATSTGENRRMLLVLAWCHRTSMGGLLLPEPFWILHLRPYSYQNIVCISWDVCVCAVLWTWTVLELFGRCRIVFVI